MTMIIFDDKLDVSLEGLYALVLEINASLNVSLNYDAVVSRGSDSTLEVSMPDGALAGWFSARIMNPFRIHLQIVTSDSDDDKDRMMHLTWFLLEAIMGEKYAESWSGSLPMEGLIRPYIFPIWADLIKMTGKEDLFSTTNKSEGEKTIITKSPNEIIEPEKNSPREDWWTFYYQFHGKKIRGGKITHAYIADKLGIALDTEKHQYSIWISGIESL